VVQLAQGAGPRELWDRKLLSPHGTDFYKLVLRFQARTSESLNWSPGFLLKQDWKNAVRTGVHIILSRILSAFAFLMFLFVPSVFDKTFTISSTDIKIRYYGYVDYIRYYGYCSYCCCSIQTPRTKKVDESWKDQ
jgi:hypothetical protein